jgi:hypothetical protein
VLKGIPIIHLHINTLRSTTLRRIRRFQLRRYESLLMQSRRLRMTELLPELEGWHRFEGVSARTVCLP